MHVGVEHIRQCLVLALGQGSGWMDEVRLVPADPRMLSLKFLQGAAASGQEVALEYHKEVHEYPTVSVDASAERSCLLSPWVRPEQ